MFIKQKRQLKKKIIFLSFWLIFMWFFHDFFLLPAGGGAGPHGVVSYFPPSGPAPWAADIISSGGQDSIS